MKKDEKMRTGANMIVLEEAKEIMEKVGCQKAFVVYKLELNNISEVKSCNKTGESIEVEKDINSLIPIIEQKIEIDTEKPIECPLNSLMNKYLEFSLKNRTITPCNISKD